MSKTFKNSIKISAVIHGIIVALLIGVPLIRGCMAKRHKKPQELITFVNIQPEIQPEPLVEQQEIKPEPPKPQDDIPDQVKKKPTPKPSPTPQPTKKATAKPSRTPTPTPTAKATAKPKPTQTPKPKPTRKPRPTPRIIVRNTPVPRMSQQDIKKLLSADLPHRDTGQTGGQPGQEVDRSTPEWYKASIQQTLYNKWNQPTSLSTGVGQIVRVQVRITQDGTVTSKRIVRPSGVPQLDASVQATLNTITRLSPLPASIKTEYLDMDIEFELQR